jgi:hypothetical protein
VRDQRVTLPTATRVQTLLAASRRIEEAGIDVADIAVRRPSLDDVFLSLTATPGQASGTLRPLPSGSPPHPHPATSRATA